MKCWCSAGAVSRPPVGSLHTMSDAGVTPSGQSLKKFARRQHITALSSLLTLHAAATSATHQQQVVNARRKEAVDRFQRDSRVRAALLSITAAGVRALPAKLSACCSLLVCSAQQCGACIAQQCSLECEALTATPYCDAGRSGASGRPARTAFVYTPTTPALPAGRHHSYGSQRGGVC